jgi:hypothetical protein
MAVATTETYEVPRLSIAERDLRWRKLRGAMDARG